MVKWREQSAALQVLTAQVAAQSKELLIEHTRATELQQERDSAREKLAEALEVMKVAAAEQSEQYMQCQAALARLTEENSALRSSLTSITLPSQQPQSPSVHTEEHTEPTNAPQQNLQSEQAQTPPTEQPSKPPQEPDNTQISDVAITENAQSPNEQHDAQQQ